MTLPTDAEYVLTTGRNCVLVERHLAGCERYFVFGLDEGADATPHEHDEFAALFFRNLWRRSRTASRVHGR